MPCELKLQTLLLVPQNSIQGGVALRATTASLFGLRDTYIRPIKPSMLNLNAFSFLGFFDLFADSKMYFSLYLGVFLWENPKKDHWSKITGNHGVSKEGGE